MEAWDGKDRVDWLDINEHDSFAYRTVLALKHMQEQDPGGDWEYFLTQDKTGVRWSDVYLVGYSYGSQTLAVVSKYVRIGRGIATSGPVDEGFPNATWMKAPSLTPLDRMIGLFGSENLDTKVMTTTNAGWLAPEITLNANPTLADLKDGHLFILTGEGHGEFCAGDGGKWKVLCNYAFGQP
jgi:phage tail protein X